MTKLTTALLLLVLCLGAKATVHTVTLSSDNKTNPQPGMFRYYVNNCNSGDTISFAVDSVGLDTTIFMSTKKITIDGGNGVIIDGNGTNRVFDIMCTQMSAVNIKGLIIQNGYGLNYAGGMYAFVIDNTITVENCTFKNNTTTAQSDAQGGALRTNGGYFINCSFINNTANANNDICGGGGAYSVDATFVNCVFAGNNAKYGGGIYAYNTDITNCTFTQNNVSISDNGGGINAENSDIINSIIYNNTANGVENNVKLYNGSFTYCALENNNSNVGLNNNIGLTQSPFLHSGVDSLSLKPGSICIDAGNSQAPNITNTDFAGNKRVSGSKIDIGAYEFFVPSVITGTVKYEYGLPLKNYALSSQITTDSIGKFALQVGSNNIKPGDTIYFTPPLGYQFHPNKLIVTDSTFNLNITAYNGIVYCQNPAPGNQINWGPDTVNVFCDVLLDSIKLFINPGTTVRFHGYYGIRVNSKGSITAKGNYNKQIFFIPADSSNFMATDWYYKSGSWNGIKFENMSANADSSVFEFCTITHAKSYTQYGTDGAAININTFNKTRFAHCYFTRNYNNPASGMSSIAGGGALRFNKSKATVINSVFFGNGSKSDGSNIWGGGGAICLYYSTGNIVNCTFASNTALNQYGGAVISIESDVNIYNSILYFNTDYYGNGQLYGPNLNLYNCNVEGGNTFDASIYQNCVNSNPSFTNLQAGNLSLTNMSPSINSGKYNLVSQFIDTIDIEGNSRVFQNLIDCGAYEYQQNIDLTVSGLLTTEYGQVLPNFTLCPNVVSNEQGFFSFNIANAGLNIGDTIALNNPVGAQFYPTKLIVGWDKPRLVTLTAYNGIVVDNQTNLNGNVNWPADTINVMDHITIKYGLLNIEAGAYVRFHNYTQFNITDQGAINAIGTKTDSIVFTYAYPWLSDYTDYSGTNFWQGFSLSDQRTDAPKSTFEYCRIQHAYKTKQGGGLSVVNFNNLIIKNCDIEKNLGARGGGIFVENCSIDIINCRVQHNWDRNNGGWIPQIGGGGIYLYYSNSNIVGCIIANNKTGNSGAGMLITYSNPTIINTTIINNLAYNNSKGESLFLHESSPIIYNTIMYGDNTFQFEAYELNNASNTAQIYNCCIKGGNEVFATTYNNCINTTPLFADAISYTPAENSPCNNKGTTNLPVMANQTDIYGNRRVMGKQIDIGAVENTEFTLIAQAGDAVVNIPVQFSAQAINGTITSYEWDFNADNNSDTDIQNPQYTYTSTGQYKVRLVAHIQELLTSDTIFIDVIVNNPVFAGFKANQTAGAAPFIVNFTDTSLNNPKQWFWNFGDDSTSTQQNPVHKYLKKGQYTVTLVAKNSASTDTIIKTNYITVVDGYLMKNGTYTTNSGMFFDDGGYYNTYKTNTHDTLTFYPATANSALSFNFTSFNLTSNDRLKIFDGPDSQSNLIGVYYDNNNIGTITATNPQGAITFVFYSGNSNTYSKGWVAQISVKPMYNISFSALANGYILTDSIQKITIGNNSAPAQAIPNYGYKFVQWQNSNGSLISINNPLIIKNVNSDSSLFAKFDHKTYNVTFYCNIDGYLEGSLSQSVIHGGNATSIKAIPVTGYSFYQWQTINGDSISNINPITVTNVISDTTIWARFKPLTTTNSNLANNINVFPNPANQNINIECSNCYKIEIVSINGTILKTIMVNKTINNIDISYLGVGFYMLYLHTPNSKKVLKFTKQ